jgi:N-acetylglucosamine-6-phosphate deacetylase
VAAASLDRCCCTLGTEGLDVGGAAVPGLIDLHVEGAEPGLVLVLRRVVEHRISTCARRLHAEQGEDVHLASLGSDQRREVSQTFGVG